MPKLIKSSLLYPRLLTVVRPCYSLRFFSSSSCRFSHLSLSSSHLSLSSSSLSPRFFSSSSSNNDNKDKPKADDLADGDVGRLNDRPDGMIKRHVRILRPARIVTQQGHSPNFWIIEFDRKQSEKWVNPLMGWTSTSDTTQQLEISLRFDSKQEAVDYCKKQGFSYEIVEPHDPKKKPKAYADNFKFRKN